MSEARKLPRSATPSALGLFAGITATLLLSNPGAVQPDEFKVLVKNYRAVRAAQESFEEVAWALADPIRDGDVELTQQLWGTLYQRWQPLSSAIDVQARDLWDVYQFDLLAAPDEPDDEPDTMPDVEPEPDPVDPDPTSVVVPSGENEVHYLVRQARAARPDGYVGALGEVITIDLPPMVQAFRLGNREGRGDQVYANWIGAATLVLQGAPTEVFTTGGSGWGSSITLDTQASYAERTNPGSDPSWEGRVHFKDLTIYASGSSGVTSLMAYGTLIESPYKDVRFERCNFLDNPDGVSWTKWGGLFNQAAVSAVDCFVDMPRSKEHWLYGHHPFSVDTEILRNRVVAVGGQVLQYVNRPYEGPDFGRSHVLVADNHFTGYARDPSRAASAVTFAGAGVDVTLRDNLVYSLVAPYHSGGKTFGAVVFWDGQSYYDVLTGLGTKDAHPEGTYGNGNIVVEGNVFGQDNGNRPVVNVQDALDFKASGNYVFGKSISFEMDNLGMVMWEDNNRNEDQDRAAGAGIPVDLLVSAPLYVDGTKLGNAEFSLVGPLQVPPMLPVSVPVLPPAGEED